MKTQGEIETAICDGMSRFEQDYMGRGPKDIHAHLIGDLLVVRLQGVLTAAEQHLVQSLPSENGRDLLKQVRTHLIETARPLMEARFKRSPASKYCACTTTSAPSPAKRSCSSRWPSHPLSANQRKNKAAAVLQDVNGYRLSLLNKRIHCPSEAQIEGWLKTLGIESRCQWDVLVFLYRHQSSLVSAEHIVRFLGYATAEVVAALDSLKSSGLVKPSRVSQGVRLYQLTAPVDPTRRDALERLRTLADSHTVRLLLDRGSDRPDQNKNDFRLPGVKGSET
jgi:DNA-binding MarR family transcriptional regulator